MFFLIEKAFFITLSTFSNISMPSILISHPNFVLLQLITCLFLRMQWGILANIMQRGILANMKTKVVGIEGQLEEPVLEDVQILLTFEEDLVYVRSLGPTKEQLLLDSLISEL